MPKYKLSYFPVRGRAETARYLLALGGIEYEDQRLTREQFAEVKNTMPFAQMPVLEVDGIKISQTLVIARFIAKRIGLAGKDDIQEALVESYASAANDIIMAMVPIFFETDEARKAQLQKKFKEETGPQQLSKLEGILSANPSGYFVGGEVTWADVFMFDTVSWLRTHALSDAELSTYPKIMALESKIKALPRIAAWIAKRPKTDF